MGHAFFSQDDFEGRAQKSDANKLVRFREMTGAEDVRCGPDNRSCAIKWGVQRF